jgi:dihydroxyacetone kinase-like protein
MVEAIAYEHIERMIRMAAENIRTHCDELSKLDAAIGDGDHGTTIVRAMDVAESIVRDNAGKALKPLLKDVGWGVMGVDGGATGPLLGSFLMGMSAGLGETDAVDAKATVQMFEGGLEGLRKRSKARIGDKTMMDAMIPAVQALSEAVENGASISESMSLAADAAQKGAASTKELKATFGRAKNLGDRAIGYQDPGATSISLIFRGFSDALKSI